MVDPVAGARGAPVVVSCEGLGPGRRVLSSMASSWVVAVAAVAVIAALAVIATWWPPESIAVAASLLALAAAAAVDVDRYRLPDRLVAAAAAPVVLVVLVALASPWVGSLDALGSTTTARAAATGALVAGGPLLVVHLVSPASLGFGDVKAGTVIGAGLGLVDWRLGMVALCLATGTTAAWAIGRRRRVVPFGPGLVGGAVAALVIARLAGLSPVTIAGVE